MGREFFELSPLQAIPKIGKKVIDFRQQARGAELRPRIVLHDKKGEIIKLYTDPKKGKYGAWGREYDHGFVMRGLVVDR